MPDRPHRAIALVGEAHQALLDHLDALSGRAGPAPDPRGPSRLPDWTIGHVLTHIARNAEGLARVLAGAERGEPAEQYVGGAPARDAAIAEGAGRSWPELVADVRTTAAAFAAQIDAQTDWSGAGIGSHGGPVPAVDVPFRRCREVFVHHVDLGLVGYGPEQWPADYVREELRRQTMSWNARQPMGAGGLPAAAMEQPERQRLLWLLGRTTIEGLAHPGAF